MLRALKRSIRQTSNTETLYDLYDWYDLERLIVPKVDEPDVVGLYYNV